METRQHPIDILLCYAHRDRQLCEELQKHLMPLQNAGIITLWADTDVQAGKDWKKELLLHLETSHVILLLISADFMASSYCYGIAMPKALQRHQSGKVHVIPIILRPTAWEQTPLAKLQALPANALPITDPQWHNQDNSFLDVVKGLRKIIEEMRGEPLSSSDIPSEQTFAQNGMVPPSLQKQAFWLLPGGQKRFFKFLLPLLIAVLLLGMASSGLYLLVKAGMSNSAGTLPATATPTQVSSAMAMVYYHQYTSKSPTHTYTPLDTGQWTNGAPAYGTCNNQGTSQYNAQPGREGDIVACVAPFNLMGDYALQATLIVQQGAGAGLVFGFNAADAASGSYYYWSFCRLANCPSQGVFLNYGLRGGKTLCLGPGAGPNYAAAYQYCNQTSQAVKPTLGQPNVLTVIVLHNEIYLYVNATFIIAISPIYLTNGQVGIAAIAANCPCQTEITFQNLKIWPIQD